MRKFTEEEISYIKENYNKISLKDMGAHLKRDPKTISNKLKSIGVKLNRAGTSKFSRKKRVFDSNDYYFSKLTLENCYWAGFVAADGYVGVGPTKSLLRIFLSREDREHLEIFKKSIEFEGEIFDGESVYSYNGVGNKSFFSSLGVTSKQIVEDLNTNFNIYNKKSLCLEPPALDEDIFIDAFIIGYIDGDGSIFFTEGKKQKVLNISILGTRNILEWIKNRFEIILREDLSCIYPKGNICSLQLSNRRARAIFKHFEGCPVPKLNRKWSKKILDYCDKYTKNTRKSNLEKYKMVAIGLHGKTVKEASEDLGMSKSLLYYYKKQPSFQKILEGIAKEKEVDIEDAS